MKVLFIEYPKCSTCKRAKKYLDDKKIEYDDRHIVEQNPTYEELKSWVEKYNIEIKKLFNTSGLLYKSMKLKDSLAQMTDEEKLKLLATNGMLVKRPLVIANDFILIGFKDKEWDIMLQNL